MPCSSPRLEMLRWLHCGSGKSHLGGGEEWALQSLNSTVPREGTSELLEGNTVPREGTSELLEGNTVPREGTLELLEGNTVPREGTSELLCNRVNTHERLAGVDTHEGLHSMEPIQGSQWEHPTEVTIGKAAGPLPAASQVVHEDPVQTHFPISPSQDYGPVASQERPKQKSQTQTPPILSDNQSDLLLFDPPPPYPRPLLPQAEAAPLAPVPGEPAEPDIDPDRPPSPDTTNTAEGGA
ncbi:hypothetical protein ACRRTK_013145 [Alexandromys fortis]